MRLNKLHVKKFGRIALAVLLIITVCMTSLAFAHGGRTDSSGGHRDNKNKSGLGYYHYHCGGNPPHLHEGGACPYSPKASTSTKSSTSVKSSASQTSTKAQVKWAQAKLNDLGYTCGTPDGSIGKKTLAAIKAFQKDYGLTVDGKLGPKTLAALKKL